MYIVAALFAINSAMVLTIYKPQPQECGIIIEVEDEISKLVEREEQYVEPEQQREAGGAEGERPKPKGVTPLEALRIPGVLAYGFSFFCVKFSVYAVMLWLPMFLSKEFNYSNHVIANL